MGTTGLKTCSLRGNHLDSKPVHTFFFFPSAFEYFFIKEEIIWPML